MNLTRPTLATAWRRLRDGCAKRKLASGPRLALRRRRYPDCLSIEACALPPGLDRNRTSLFWTHLQPVAADYSYAIATVPNTGGTPADLLQLPSALHPVGADDVAVYGATQGELLAVSLADRTKRTLAQVWGIASVSVTGSTLTMTNRGHAMPPEITLSDPAGTAPVSSTRLPRSAALS